MSQKSYTVFYSYESMKTELLELVREIPYARVTSYGMLAQILDIRYDIKTSGYIVGRLLSSMPQSERTTCPWRRVVNKVGYISSLKLGRKWLLQKQLLEKEWLLIINDSVDIVKYGYGFKTGKK